MKKAQWEIVRIDHQRKIVFIADLCYPGFPSVTNDAERVFWGIQAQFGIPIRVIYQDSVGQWDEIVMNENGVAGTASFKPWHGDAWDIISH